MTHLLGESCGALTLEESIDLLSAREKVISELEKRVCELELQLSNEKEKHSNESDKLYFLLNKKDVIIKEMEKELEERPTQELVDDLVENLKILEVEISEKTSLLETAEKKIVELSTKIEKSYNKRIPKFKRIFSLRAQEAGTSKTPWGPRTTNNTAPFTTPEVSVVPLIPVASTTPEVSVIPLIPVASTTKRLVFFKEGDGHNFDLDDMLYAQAEVLINGTFGTSYKIVLESGQTMVVKRLNDVNLLEDQFLEKAKKIEKMEDKNILPIVAYYCSNNEKLFIYDHMPTGSVSTALHANNGTGQAQLNWPTKEKIILSVSQSISYIHSIDPTFCHGNIRSSNVLLTPTYEALLSNPGLYSLLSKTSTHSGADSYHAPEITDLREMTQKADVYSFGILVLELLSGKEPTREILYEARVDLPSWVLSFENIGEAFDVQHEDMTQLMQLVVICTEDNPDNRPSMVNVVVMIEEILKCK